MYEQEIGYNHTLYKSSSINDFHFNANKKLNKLLMRLSEKWDCSFLADEGFTIRAIRCISSASFACTSFLYLSLTCGANRCCRDRRRGDGRGVVRKVFWLESCAGILREIEGGMAVFTPRKHEKQVVGLRLGIYRVAKDHLSKRER